MNYIGLSKGHSFIMTTIYLTILNVLLDINTLHIVIIVNPINKTLIFSKGIHLNSIHECIDISYIIIDITKAFIAIVTIFTAVFEPFIVI